MKLKMVVNIIEDTKLLVLDLLQSTEYLVKDIPSGGGGGGSDDKADKVTNAVNGHLAGLDSTGNLTDSEKNLDESSLYLRSNGNWINLADEIFVFDCGTSANF